MAALTAEQQRQLDRFCWQYLQLDLAPELPDDETLRDAEAQELLYHRLFAPDATALSPPPRYQLRVLKQLIAKIESCIKDWDEHVSIQLTLGHSASHTQGAGHLG